MEGKKGQVEMVVNKAEGAGEPGEGDVCCGSYEKLKNGVEKKNDKGADYKECENN